jgi:hypothetical protein
MRRKTVMDRMIKKLMPFTAAAVLRTSASAHAQVGALDGMPSASTLAASGGLSPSVMPPQSTEMPTHAPSMPNFRITNNGPGGMQRPPGWLPRFH